MPWPEVIRVQFIFRFCNDPMVLVSHQEAYASRVPEGADAFAKGWAAPGASWIAGFGK